MTDDTITAQIIRFRESATCADLMSQIRASDRKGMSGTFGPTRLLTWCMAGRVMWTFQRYGGTVTLLSEEKNPSRMGLHSLNLEPHEAIAAIDDVIAHAGDLHNDNTVWFGGIAQ